MAIEQRLAKRYKHLRKWAKRNQISAFRLYDRDIPEYPFIVDLYNDKAIIYLRLNDKDIGKEHHIEELFQGLDKLGFPKRNCFVKSRKVNKGSEQYQKLAKKNIIEKVSEGPLQFEVNLSDYLDSGLFLDHRNWRSQFLDQNLTGLKALNLFCYTGSISSALAKSGAQVTSVDLNPNYIEWAKRNMILNNIDPQDHHWHVGDCLEFLKECEDENKERFDIIVIDPPSYSVSKKFKGTWDIQRDHVFLLSTAHKLLKKTAYFSTNLRSFKLDESIAERLSIRETTQKTIPEDYHDKKIHKSFTWNV
jgi:23S rRNA (cytosine1962-C5)-methyltransferase/23S rRNA (guanine2445-N2)-methyltransferase / 23S rRNA (guanine2069-N7)-methyltransferase